MSCMRSAQTIILETWDVEILEFSLLLFKGVYTPRKSTNNRRRSAENDKVCRSMIITCLPNTRNIKRPERQTEMSYIHMLSSALEQTTPIQDLA